MSNDEFTDPDTDADQSVWDEIGADSGSADDLEETGSPNGEPNAAEINELFAEIDSEQSSSDTTTADAEEIFDRMDVSVLDGEALWDELAGLETVTDELSEHPHEATVDSKLTEEPLDVGTPTRADPTASPLESDATDTVVDKRLYCQRCPYFSSPPEVACSNDGTSILEVLIDGQFRVRDCPVVTDSGPDRTILNDGS